MLQQSKTPATTAVHVVKLGAVNVFWPKNMQQLDNMLVEIREVSKGLSFLLIHWLVGWVNE